MSTAHTNKSHRSSISVAAPRPTTHLMHCSRCLRHPTRDETHTGLRTCASASDRPTTMSRQFRTQWRGIMTLSLPLTAAMAAQPNPTPASASQSIRVLCGNSSSKHRHPVTAYASSSACFARASCRDGICSKHLLCTDHKGDNPKELHDKVFPRRQPHQKQIARGQLPLSLFQAGRSALSQSLSATSIAGQRMAKALIRFVIQNKLSLSVIHRTRLP